MNPVKNNDDVTTTDHLLNNRKGIFHGEKSLAYANQIALYIMMALKTTSLPDTMYLHEAMKQSNSNKFNKAMQR